MRFVRAGGRGHPVVWEVPVRFVMQGSSNIGRVHPFEPTTTRLRSASTGWVGSWQYGCDPAFREGHRARVCEQIEAGRKR